MVLLMFFQAVYFGHFLSFYTMQLEPPKLLRTVLGALGVRHGVAAGTQRLYASCYQNVFMSLSALVVPPLLLPAGVGFLLVSSDGGNILLMKYNQYRITRA